VGWPPAWRRRAGTGEPRAGGGLPWWGVRADEVRERAEQRLGTGPGDPRVCCDPEYARALDAGRPFTEAARAAARALRASGAAAGGCAGPGGAAPETAIGSPRS